jgi:2-dehydro-3-deoxyphosphogluconate aldolase/(4S)-4-hydroxy-2-oxoglutarate aldolase
MLERLQTVGLHHVEIGWNASPRWAEQVSALLAEFPALAIGAAGVVGREAVAAAIAAGCSYAVSPVIEPERLAQAERAGMALIPGVMTPSEVQAARNLGCRLVKLFPAVTLGMAYWRRLRDPLGEPLPFCIAAGGITPETVAAWLHAGVDAVALGSGLASAALQEPQSGSDPLQQLLSCLPG